uniref:Microsomal glutathione S-transferase 2 n=1 Tax=Ovis aries TaxID=9940 RepID=A0AC11D0Z2_SHEEP
MAGNSILLAALSVLSACQQSYFAMQVGKARLKYKVMPPSVSGSPDFERIFRAQQNCVEFYPIFIITLWMAGWYFNQVFATCLGLVYIYSRHQYFWGYAEAAKKSREVRMLWRAAWLLTAAISWGDPAEKKRHTSSLISTSSAQQHIDGLFFGNDKNALINK